jgi:hypothetical protein
VFILLTRLRKRVWSFIVRESYIRRVVGSSCVSTRQTHFDDLKALVIHSNSSPVGLERWYAFSVLTGRFVALRKYLTNCSRPGCSAGEELGL